MKQYKYIGLFVSAEGNTYQLEVKCYGFLQAFFLLTAEDRSVKIGYRNCQNDIRKVLGVGYYR